MNSIKRISAMPGAFARRQRSCVRASSSAARIPVNSGSEPRLFTPGPLTTSDSTKQAMLVDMGSRDDTFLRNVAEIRTSLLTIASTSVAHGYEAVLMQGSGTACVEAMLGSLIPKQGGKVLVASNGAYGKRMVEIARILGIPCIEIGQHEARAVNVRAVLQAVAADKSITHVAAVHHETTAGVLNDMGALGKGLASIGRPISFLVDSMSAFGAYPTPVHEWGATAVVSSANKCIEGVPGFSFAVVKRSALESSKGYARSLSLDLVGQWMGLQANGQFRFTPPVHALNAFRQALRELEMEGGPAARLARYESNAATLISGMSELGLTPYVEAQDMGCIITTFLVPDHPSFSFQHTYKSLAAKGMLIYPGKTTSAESMRVGSIGRLFPSDMSAMVSALAEVLKEQGVPLPVKQRKEVLPPA